MATDGGFARHPAMKAAVMLIPLTPSDWEDVLEIWRAAAHPHFPISPRLLGYNLAPCSGEIIEGRLAALNGQPLGFIIACALPSQSPGWVSLHAVHPSAQRQGIGSALLDWAEAWLAEQGCQRIRIGGNLRPFAPGMPDAMGSSLAFYQKRGYAGPPTQPCEYDVARSLSAYQPLYPKPPQAELLPMQAGQEALLLEFLEREYPGRWAFEARQFIRDGGRPSDFLLLWVNRSVQGFCRITLEDSERPIERFYPQRLPRPWGQFGPLGISKSVRGQGLGGYLIDAAAAHLHTLGVNGCVIDWTSLVDLYAKFGFAPYNRYFNLFKSLTPAD